MPALAEKKGLLGSRIDVLKQAQLSLENAQKDRAKTTEASTFEIEVFPLDNGYRDNREKHSCTEEENNENS